MDTIQSYLDNMFQAWPETGEVLEVKNELLTHMVDKYNELKAQGKSENEAVGIVISEFGNIDELMKEIGVDKNAKEDENADIPYVGKSEAESYIRMKEKNGKRVGFGVAAILFGVATLILLTGVADYMPGGDDSIAARLFCVMGMTFLLFGVIVGVVLFIISGTMEEKYKYLDGAFRISDSLRQELEILEEENRSRNMMSVIAGVCLCIFAAFPIIVFSLLLNEHDFLMLIALCITIIMVAAAVYIFISFGARKEAYEKLLQVKDYTDAKQDPNKKENRIVSLVGSVVWPITVVAFLLWGFFGDGFGIAWILFPVVGILFGAFSALVNGISEAVGDDRK